ncbi:hypothetical protein [Trichormus variabilis]|jgi:hypothetical protein|uniref:hypothetical protein n=1 Tax=Anabaena variabilis TaxID=264691 RepID=UPI00003A1975|nr:hypothetical protein [Trichormus variabilis]MBC1259460.1 hypothetical protein [Trichormus variabilis V5]PLZ87927.1 hypothetical protein CI594_20840 [Fischerella thermalis CCMEE 5196]QHD83846.1 hypothetical protein GSQ19_29000 [Trichormus variabilis 0441]
MKEANLLRSWMRGNSHVQFCRRVKESDFFIDFIQTIARTPIIVALTVVVGDLLAGLVTG